MIINPYALANPLPANIVAWWKCNEGSGSTLYDSSGNGINATLYGSPTWTTHPSGVGAIKMNGQTCWGDAGNPSQLQFSAAASSKFTISAWTYSTGLNFYQTFVGKWSANVGYKCRWSASTYQRGWQIQAQNYVIGPTYETLGVWHHIVLTFDTTIGTSSGSISELYYDGSYNNRIQGFRFPNALVDSGTNVILGLGDTTYGSCTYCDIRVYNALLSAGTISALYSAGPA